MRVCAVPNTLDSASDRRRGRYGALILETYEPDSSRSLPSPRRSIALVNDGGRRTYDEFGEPLPFERTLTPRGGLPGEGFSFAVLGEYLAALGLDPFSSDFYRPEAGALMIEKSGAPFPETEEFSFQNVAERFG